MTEVTVRTPRGDMPAYVATPAGTGPWAAVVVVHDFAGMSQDLRNQADWLASEGFLAAAPDMYYFSTRLRCLWTMVRNLSAGRGRTFADLDALRGWLSERPDCTGNIGVIGFCMGGGYALALAPGHGYGAASVNYGGCPQNAEQALEGACPIVGSYGARDGSPLGRRSAVRLEEALTTLGVEHDIKIYPDASHGFMNDPDRADQTLLLVLLSKVSGTRYQQDATHDARRRIVSFFNKHLGRPV